jgi:hypothetical protein
VIHRVKSTARDSIAVLEFEFDTSISADWGLLRDRVIPRIDENSRPSSLSGNEHAHHGVASSSFPSYASLNVGSPSSFFWKHDSAFLHRKRRKVSIDETDPNRPALKLNLEQLSGLDNVVSISTSNEEVARGENIDVEGDVAMVEDDEFPPVLSLGGLPIADDSDGDDDSSLATMII